MSKSTFECNINVDEQEQESNFQNACLSGVGKHAVSIAVYPPRHMENLTQEQIKSNMESDFSDLVSLGYSVIIAIGNDRDSMED